jgi:DnaJ-class molecular chaperone
VNGEVEMLKYFDGAKTEKTINKRYRELAKKYHPDCATSDYETEKFTEIMKEINAEHQEVLVLLKHKAFDTVQVKATVKEKNYSQSSGFIDGFASLFQLTNQQKKELAEQGKSIVNSLIDSFIQNNLRR